MSTTSVLGDREEAGDMESTAVLKHTAHLLDLQSTQETNMGLEQ